MKVTSQLKRLFNEKELDDLKRGMASDKNIIPAVLRVIEDISNDLNKPTSLSELNVASWAISKAHTEGGRYYLEQLYNIFKE